ncbi:hypothetical protein [Mycobacterium aquaticum]|uniref:hypothetical protein n=1 Tax=Mycobacterium aquaticum TaxID=1927124 RepID=UPI001FE5BED8|nr:hypothetical protein [Mycobacterium aquaticum]
MDRVWVRNTAISAAIACGAMVAGPGVSGTAVASADLLGIDVDVLGIFGHKDNKKSSNHRTGTNGKQNSGPAKTGRPGNQKTGKSAQADKQKSGLGGESSGQSAGSTEGTTNRAAQSANTPATLSAGTGVAETSVSVPEAQVSIPSTGGGGGGGGAATSGRIGRAPNLAPVPTAPSSRQIVIHAKPAEAPWAPTQSAPEAQSPSIGSPSAPEVAAPVPAPPVMIVLPLPPLPEIAPPAPSGGGGVPAAPPAAPSTPHVTIPSAEPPQHATPAINAIPESFRIGYADYLRVSSTTDLLFAVLPGLAGMVLLTAAGGAVGFRQARAARTLPTPQIARFLP